MDVRRSWDHFLEPPSGRGLVAIPFVLIVTITVLDIYTGPDVQLGPLLVIAPALTASLAGTRLTAVAGVLAVAAQVFIAVSLGGLTTPNRMAQIAALAVLSALVLFMRFVRERRDRALSLARSVAETAQRVLLRPPPRRIGPLQVAWLYMSAQDEAEIGGDLFAFARAAHAATRVVIGDVRGNGLAAIGEASLVLGAFREGAHRQATLPELVTALEDSVSRNLEDVADTEHDPGEHFTTCLVLELPDDAPLAAEMINRGHPPPLLVHDQQVTALHAREPLPPLGVCERPIEDDRIDPFTFTSGDMLVLYTDGVIEARDSSGAFYPLAERVASFPAGSPDTLLHHIHRDLLTHIGGCPADDAALLVIKRAPSHRPHLTPHPVGHGHHRRHHLSGRSTRPAGSTGTSGTSRTDPGSRRR